MFTRVVFRLSVAAFCLVNASLFADVLYEFSPDGSGTKLTVSGNGVLDGLNSSLPFNIIPGSSQILQADSTSTDNFDLFDTIGVGGLRAGFGTDFRLTSSTLPFSFVSSDVEFFYLPGTLFDAASQNLTGVVISGWTSQNFASTKRFTVLDDSGTTTGPTSVTMNTGLTLTSTSPFTNFTGTGTAVYTNPVGTAGNNRITFSVVPEPSSLLCLTLSCIVLCGCRWSRALRTS